MKFSTGFFPTGNMVNNIGKILTQFFQRDSLDSLSENELRYFIKQYPYFAPGHFLLAKKLQIAGEKRAFEREVSVTSAYFTNPAWLQYILRDDVLTDHDAVDEKVVAAVPSKQAPLHPADLEKSVDDSDPIPAPEENVTAEQEKIAEKRLEHSSELTQEEVEEIKAADADPVNDVTVGNDPANNIAIVDHPPSEDVDSAAPEEPTEATTETQTHQFVVSDSANTISELSEPGNNEPGSDGQVGDAAIQTATEEAAAREADAEPVAEAAVPETIEPPTEVNTQAEKLSRVLQNDANPSQSNNELIAFDPYHTIDYFASQGIKLRLEDFNKDKLGQQLKSFTEWIRSMKRLPVQTQEENKGDSEQHSIRKIAEHSVEGKEVLTESMAEVWVKQGNFEKARQIYRKLSLQNPSKSTYFAAKIDQLNAL